MNFSGRTIPCEDGARFAFPCCCARRLACSSRHDIILSNPIPSQCHAPYYDRQCRAEAAARMAPLWSSTGYFGGRARDVVPNHTVTCCTKWHGEHTANHTEWTFEFDHIFATETITIAAPPILMPYTYPGTASTCTDPTCTGEFPPENVTAVHQGSWHRGWCVDLQV